MPFLAADPCLQHGQIGLAPCCTGLNAFTWNETGAVYPGGQHACWYANCVTEGKAAGPNFQGDYCCTGLDPVNGYCQKPTTSQPPPSSPTCATIGKTPIAGQVCCSGLSRDATGVCNSTAQPSSGFHLDSTTMMMIGGGLLLVLMMSKKKR